MNDDSEGDFEQRLRDELAELATVPHPAAVMPTKVRRQRWAAAIGVVAAIAALVGIIAIAPTDSPRGPESDAGDDPSPESPVLRDGSVVRLESERATAGQLDASLPILAARLDAAGIEGTVLAIRDGGITIAAPGPLPRGLMKALARPGKLEFRAVLEGPVPVGATVLESMPGVLPSTMALPVGADICGSLVGGEAGVWQYDIERTYCYSLGESLLPEPKIASAEAAFEFAEWSVTVEFGDDRFVEFVALRYAGRSIAIVVDDAVLSAPTVQEGITASAVQITGSLTEFEAKGLAAALSARELLPVEFEVVGGDPEPEPTTTSPAGPPPHANRDHWHVALGVDVCGTWLPDAPEFYVRAGTLDDRVGLSIRAGIHSHGIGLIDMHPFSDDEAGERATLRTFLEWGGWLGDNDGLDLWAPIDQCGAGADPVVEYFVNGDRVEQGLDHKLDDQDVIVISIGNGDYPGDPPSKANLANPEAATATS